MYTECGIFFWVHTSLFRLIFNAVPFEEAMSPDHPVQPIFCSSKEEVPSKQVRESFYRGKNWTGNNTEEQFSMIINEMC